MRKIGTGSVLVCKRSLSAGRVFRLCPARRKGRRHERGRSAFMAKVTLCMSTRRLPRLVSAFTVAALTVALAVVLAGPAGAAGSTGDTAAAAAGAPSPVIVLARNPRGDASRLLAEAMGAGATHVKRLSLIHI